MDHVRTKPESHLLAETIGGLAFLALVMFGAGMTVYKLISPDGWMAYLLGRGLSSAAAALVSLIVIGTVAWFSREWITPVQKNRYAELVLYGLAGLGMLYFAQMWLTGAL